MQFFVMSRHAAETMGDDHVGQPHIIISVTNIGDLPARVPTSPATVDLIRLEFDDMDDAPGLGPTAATRLFTREHARKILDSLRRSPHVGRTIVHCGAGLSRSPAIAAALTRILGGDDVRYFKLYTPNMHVYRTLLEEHFLERGQEFST